MFDIGWSELVVIGVVALVVIGPKELPTVLRTVGQWMTKIRRMASEFQGQFQEAMREAELAELKQQVDKMSDLTRTATDFNPMETAKRELETAFDAGTSGMPPAPVDAPGTSPATDTAAVLPPAADAPPVPPVAVAPSTDVPPASGSSPVSPPPPPKTDEGRAA
jgi:sec-independent protein translocase protein TatB